MVNTAWHDLHCLRRQVEKLFLDDLEFVTAVLESQYMHTMTIC